VNDLFGVRRAVRGMGASVLGVNFGELRYQRPFKKVIVSFLFFFGFFFLFALAEYLVVVILVCVWFIFCSWPSARSFSVHDSMISSLL